MWEVRWMRLEKDDLRGADEKGLSKEEAERICNLKNKIWEGVAHHWAQEEGTAGLAREAGMAAIERKGGSL